MIASMSTTAPLVALGLLLGSSLVACAPPHATGRAAAPAEAPVVVEPVAPSEPTEPVAATPPVEATPTVLAPPVEVPEPDGSKPATETPPPGWKPIPAKRSKGFPGVAFAEVRAYAFDLRVAEMPVCGMPLDADGTLCDTVEQPGVVLSPAQTKLLVGMLKKKSTWGSGSSCFLPHHGFVFYDAEGVPVAEISLCFMCEMMATAPGIPGAKKLGTQNDYGLNAKSTAQLRGLCRELGLPMCDATRPDEFSRH